MLKKKFKEDSKIILQEKLKKHKTDTLTLQEKNYDLSQENSILKSKFNKQLSEKQTQTDMTEDPELIRLKIEKLDWR